MNSTLLYPIHPCCFSELFMLVPYDEVWVTGAHSATSFEIDKEIRIGEKEVPASEYALFTIPGKDKWTIILNKSWDQYPADDYNQKEDIASVTLVSKPHSGSKLTA